MREGHGRSLSPDTQEEAAARNDLANDQPDPARREKRLRTAARAGAAV